MKQSEAIRKVHSFLAGNYELGIVDFFNKENINKWADTLQEFEGYLLSNDESLLEFQTDKIVKKMKESIQYFKENNTGEFRLNPIEGINFNPNDGVIEKRLSIKYKACYHCMKKDKKLMVKMDKENPSLIYLVCNDCENVVWKDLYGDI